MVVSSFYWVIAAITQGPVLCPTFLLLHLNILFSFTCNFIHNYGEDNILQRSIWTILATQYPCLWRKISGIFWKGLHIIGLKLRPQKYFAKKINNSQSQSDIFLWYSPFNFHYYKIFILYSRKTVKIIWWFWMLNRNSALSWFFGVHKLKKMLFYTTKTCYFDNESIQNFLSFVNSPVY